MKLLMTGFTPRGCGSTKLLYSYMSNTAVIKRALEAAGHTVDHRIVDVEEAGLATSYDAALVGLAVPQSLSSRYVYGALWAAEQFGPERTHFYVDDWLLAQLKSQLESGLREPEKRFYSLDNRHGYALAKQHTALWIRWFKFLAYSQYKLLIPAFPWTKTRRLLPGLDNVNPVIFDPTPMALTDPEITCGTFEPLNLVIEDAEDRERTWTLAAMRDVKDWFNKQCFKWPVDQYGNKRQGQPVVTERELLHMYTKRWGIIGAPYGGTVTGAAGWRVRYIHSALTRSILFLDPEEGRTAGKPYDLFRSVVEGASPDELTSIAEAQRSHLIANTWTTDHLVGELDQHVRIA